MPKRYAHPVLNWRHRLYCQLRARGYTLEEGIAITGVWSGGHPDFPASTIGDPAFGIATNWALNAHIETLTTQRKTPKMTDQQAAPQPAISDEDSALITNAAKVLFDVALGLVTPEGDDIAIRDVALAAMATYSAYRALEEAAITSYQQAKDTVEAGTEAA